MLGSCNMIIINELGFNFAHTSCWFFICICFCICIAIGIWLCICIGFCIDIYFCFCISICISPCICILKGNSLAAILWPWTVGWAQPSRRGSGATSLLHCTTLLHSVHQAVQGHPHLHCLQSWHRSYLAHIGTSSTLSPHVIDSGLEPELKALLSKNILRYMKTLHIYRIVHQQSAQILFCCN